VSICRLAVRRIDEAARAAEIHEGAHMLGINLLAVIVAAAVAFVMGGIWYSPLLFGNAWMTLRGMDRAGVTRPTMRPREILAEFARGLLVAIVLARFIVLLGVASWVGAVYLGFAVWIGFQATSIVGSVIHESYPWKLYAIHTGDALVKTLVMAVILSVWR
jgi:hypothetical protein